MKMKKFFNYYLSMTLIASLFLVSSCGDDTEDPIDAPSFTITGVEEGQETEMDVNVGETVDFTVDVVVPAGFNTLVVNQTVGTNTVEYDRESRPAGTPTSTYSYDFTYTPDEDVAGEAVIFDFIVVDENNNESSYTYTVNVNERQVTAYNTVLLAAPTEDQTNEVWFSTSTGERYSTQAVNTTTEDISSEIDFGYRYGPNAGATLAAPAAYPTEGGQNIGDWNTLNETELRSTDVSAAQFLEANDAQFIADAFENGTAGANPQRVSGLVEGQVYAFMTDPDKEDGGRYGLVHVEEIDMGTDGTGFGSDASITLNVRVVD